MKQLMVFSKIQEGMSRQPSITIHTKKFIVAYSAHKALLDMQISRAPLGVPKPAPTTRTTKNSQRAASAEPFAVAPAPTKTNPHSSFGASQTHDAIQEETTLADTRSHVIPNDGDAASEGTSFPKVFNVDTDAVTR